MMFICKKALRFWPLLLLALISSIGMVICDLFLPNLMANIVDIGIAENNMKYISETGIKMIFVAILSTAFCICIGFCATKIASLTGRNVGYDMFCHVENFSLNEFDKISVSSMITRFTNDINQIQTFIMMAIRITFTGVLTAIGGTVMAINKSGNMAVIILLSVIILAVVIFFFARKTLKLSSSLQKSTDRINGIIRETLSGMRVIRAFNNENYEENRFNDANENLTKIALTMHRVFALIMPFMMIVLNYTIVSILWTGSNSAAAGNIQAGEIMAVVQYITLILISLMMLSFILTIYPRAAISARRINEVMNIIPSIQDGTKSINDISKTEKGTVEFRNVSFKYPDAKEYALKNISFSVKQGQTLAIIGSTGSGKTTLANLIMRFYDVNTGNVIINGIDVRNISQDSLRKRISYASQLPVLFSGSIKDNLCIGNNNSTDDEIKKSAQIAQALSFIEEKEGGFSYILSQGATNLSGGQKQRLSIARAILKKPEIFIFDDTFSALDYKTDKSLRIALKQNIKATVIIIAQRVSTIKSADSIIVLDNGKICGEGTHDELLLNCPVYREIVASQQAKEEFI